MKKYVDYIVKQATQLLSIDSPSGFTEEVTNYLMKEFADIGYESYKTVKGGVMAEIPGKKKADAVMLDAHVDTLGAMVAEIKSNGRLRLAAVGGLNANNVETEICRIHTKSGQIYEGTCQLINASTHVNGEYSNIKRSFDTVEIVIDEKTSSKEETRKLGISNGDYVCFSPATRITESGYIKSRFLDDKLSAAILLGYAKYLKDEKIEPERTVFQHFTVFEEVGHGASASVPENVKEILSVDMGCVGEGLECTEHEVSICVKDSGGPYHYDIVKALIGAAEKAGIGYAADVYPFYASDVDATLKAGFDFRHGLIGPGVYASHGYERSHIDGVENTLKLLIEYLK